MITALTALLAAGVAAGYFTIAAIIVPRVRLEDATPRFARAFLIGGVAFFVGCGLTHTHIAVHALTDDEGVALHELLFHLMQVFGVWIFIYVALRTIDVRVTRRRTQQELEAQERAERLSRSNADLEQFAHVVSHDLQEPLRTVSGFAQLVSRRYHGRLDAQADQSLELMVDGCRRMGLLLDGVLKYSRVAGAGLSVERVDLDRLVREVLAGLHGVIEARGATVDVEPLPSVEGDPVQLGQLLQNLLGNALKHSAILRPHIEVWAEEHGACWHVHVRDDGVGVAPQDGERIFAMFQRAGNGDGTGIGLAVARRVAERHGGRLWVAPAPRRGSIFTFSLPRLAETMSGDEDTGAERVTAPA